MAGDDGVHDSKCKNEKLKLKKIKIIYDVFIILVMFWCEVGIIYILIRFVQLSRYNFA